MNYEDFYTPDKGYWYSLESMNQKEKFYYISYISWYIINIIILFYLFLRLFKVSIKKNKSF